MRLYALEHVSFSSICSQYNLPKVRLAYLIFFSVTIGNCSVN